jgi:glycosyltransferase involved in cell wall biosynthesis
MEFCQGLSRAGHHVVIAAPFDLDIEDQPFNHPEIHRFRYVWPDNLHIMGHGRSLTADFKLRPLSYLLLPFYLLSAFITLDRITRQQKSDLIHVHWLLPNGLVAAWVSALRRVPFVISLHGSDVYLAKSNALFKSIARYILRRASGVTACSPELLEFAIDMRAPEKAILLPYGVDVRKFKPHMRTKNLRQQLAANNEDMIIISIGRLVYKKGFDILIDACSELILSGQGIHIAIGGSGPIRDQLQKKIDELNITKNVHLLGSIPWDNVPQYLASGDIFVLPSVRDQYGNIDGLPNVLLEAMSSGTPVIASDIPGVKTVIEDQQDGILVPSADVGRLSQAINLVISNDSLRLALGKAARAKIEKSYTWDEIIKRLEKLFMLIFEDGDQK